MRLLKWPNLASSYARSIVEERLSTIVAKVLGVSESGTLATIKRLQGDDTNCQKSAVERRPVNEQFALLMKASGIVRPTAPRVEIHALLGWKLDRDGARSPRLALCLLEKAMAAARNRERSGGEASPDRFGLTTPALELAMAKQELTGAQVSRAFVDQGHLGPP